LPWLTKFYADTTLDNPRRRKLTALLFAAATTEEEARQG
jgi:hypothetical protein